MSNSMAYLSQLSMGVSSATANLYSKPKRGGRQSSQDFFASFLSMLKAKKLGAVFLQPQPFAPNSPHIPAHLADNQAVRKTNTPYNPSSIFTGYPSLNSGVEKFQAEHENATGPNSFESNETDNQPHQLIFDNVISELVPNIQVQLAAALPGLFNFVNADVNTPIPVGELAVRPQKPVSENPISFVSRSIDVQRFFVPTQLVPQDVFAFLETLTQAEPLPLSSNPWNLDTKFYGIESENFLSVITGDFETSLVTLEFTDIFDGEQNQTQEDEDITLGNEANHALSDLELIQIHIDDESLPLFVFSQEGDQGISGDTHTESVISEQTNMVSVAHDINVEPLDDLILEHEFDTGKGDEHDHKGVEIPYFDFTLSDLLIDDNRLETLSGILADTEWHDQQIAAHLDLNNYTSIDSSALDDTENVGRYEFYDSRYPIFATIAEPEIIQDNTDREAEPDIMGEDTALSNYTLDDDVPSQEIDPLSSQEHPIENLSDGNWGLGVLNDIASLKIPSALSEEAADYRFGFVDIDSEDEPQMRMLKDTAMDRRGVINTLAHKYPRTFSKSTTEPSGPVIKVENIKKKHVIAEVHGDYDEGHREITDHQPTDADVDVRNSKVKQARVSFLALLSNANSKANALQVALFALESGLRILVRVPGLNEDSDTDLRNAIDHVLAEHGISHHDVNVTSVLNFNPGEA